MRAPSGVSDGRRSATKRCSRRGRSAFSLIAIAAALFGPRDARAEGEPLPLELTWDAPAGCPEESFVSGRVAYILRGSRVAPVHVAARGKIEKAKDARFRLTLVLRTGDVEETREIAARTCQALAHAAAVVIALALDPSHDDTPIDAGPSEQRSEEMTQAVPRDPTPAPVAEPPRKPPAVISPRTAPRVRAAIGAGGAFVSGLLPDLGGGVGLSATLRLGRFRAGIAGTYWFRQSPSFQGAAGATFDMLEAGAFGAYLFPLGPVGIGPSVSAEASHVRVEGFGIREPWARSTSWPAAAIGARLEAHLTTWLAAFVRADVVVPIAAPTFTLETTRDAVRLHEPGPAAPRGVVGAEIVFP